MVVACVKGRQASKIDEEPRKTGATEDDSGDAKLRKLAGSYFRTCSISISISSLVLVLNHDAKIAAGACHCLCMRHEPAVYTTILEEV